MQTFWRLTSYLRQHTGLFLFASTSSFANVCFDILPEVLLGIAINIIEKKESSFIATTFNATDPIQQVVVLGIITIIVFLLESLFQYLSNATWADISQRIEHTLRLQVYDHVQRLKLSFFSNQPKGRLTTIINDDINQIEAFFDANTQGGLNELMRLFYYVIIIGGVYMYISPMIFVLSCLPLPVVVYITLRFQKIIATQFGHVRELASMLAAYINHNLNGILSIKALVTEQVELNRIKRASDDYKEVNTQALRVVSRFIPIVRLPITIGFVMVLVVGGIMTLKGQMTLSNFTVAVFISQRFMWPFTNLGPIVDTFQQTDVCALRVFKLLDLPTAYLRSETQVDAGDVAPGDIEYKNITFGYQGRAPLFNEFSFYISHNTTIGFVGGTGSGKSTLVKLLLRLHKLDGGEITINGTNIKDYDIATLRSCMSVVSQESFIVPGSIRENILYGCWDMSDENMIESAQEARIHDFIMSLSDGYNTLLDEQGSLLSGGQRQRIMIARALARNTDIIIFDEATSAVDNETESAIMRAIHDLHGKKTIIIIAHRLTTVRQADNIAVLESGSIIEHGTHEQLLAQNGQYKKLWKLQTGEF